MIINPTCFDRGTFRFWKTTLDADTTETVDVLKNDWLRTHYNDPNLFLILRPNFTVQMPTVVNAQATNFLIARNGPPAGVSWKTSQNRLYTKNDAGVPKNAGDVLNSENAKYLNSPNFPVTGGYAHLEPDGTLYFTGGTASFFPAGEWGITAITTIGSAPVSIPEVDMENDILSNRLSSEEDIEEFND